jgi:glutathione S-transferase
MLKIWGRQNSVNVKKALWAAEELGLKYERINAGLEHGVNKTPEYLEMNPTGLVPTIDDDGFKLWESHTIVRYFAAKHGAGSLCPSDLKARADAERWMDWAFSFSREFQRPVFWALVRTPPEKRDVKAISEAVKKCADLLAIPENTLAKKPYLAGASFTMGDIPLGCHVQLWMRLPIETTAERPPLPNLKAWFDRLCAREAYRRVVDIPVS